MTWQMHNEAIAIPGIEKTGGGVPHPAVATFRAPESRGQSMRGTGARSR